MKNRIINIISIFSVALLLVSCVNTNNKNNKTQIKNSSDSAAGTANSESKVKGTFTDSRDGKIYKTVVIDTQTWMAENLAYKTNSGCWAYNNDSNNVKTYGYLYDWETAKTVCPAGWHLPTDTEWTTLTTFLGGESVAGGKLKEIGTAHWTSPNSGATNESGFSALPGGYRYDGGTFDWVGYYGHWWSSTVDNRYNTYSAWEWSLGYGVSVANSCPYSKGYAFTVRCVKDK